MSNGRRIGQCGQGEGYLQYRGLSKCEADLGCQPPVFFLLVDMALKAEPVYALGFGEITLEVLTVVLICYFVAELKKGR